MENKNTLKTKSNEKNVHLGHRKRLTDLAVSAGLDSMSDVQVVEFFLTYIFPRSDVNPLAHRLLNRFGTFTQMVEANVVDLMSVDGINERAAKMISMFGELFFYYTTAKMGKKYVVTCKSDIIAVVEDCLRFRTTENMILLALSASNIITHRRQICRNDAGQVSVTVLELTNFLASAKPASLVIAHCHPYGKATPSKTDDDAYALVADVCKTCGVNFIDSFIVGEDGVYSQKDSKLLRFYCDIEQLKTTFRDVLE